MKIPENGDLKNLDQCKNIGDNAGITFSWCSLTQGEDCKGTLVSCIREDYAAINPSDPDLSELKQVVGIKNSPRLVELLKKRAYSREMVQATIRTYKRIYYNNALKHIEKVGVTSALAIISLIRMTTHYQNYIYAAQRDNGIQMEWGNHIEPHGAGVEADRKWLEAFWSSYKEAGQPGHKSHDGEGWGGWRNEADVWLANAKDNMDCKKPINWTPWHITVTLGKPSKGFFDDYNDLFVEEGLWS